MLPAAATPTSASALPAGGAPPLAMSKSPPVTKRELSELKHRSSDSEFDKRRGGRQNSDDDSEASGDIKLPRMSLDEKWSPPNRNSPRAGAAFLCRGASFLAIHLTRIPLCPPPRQNLLTCVTPRPRRRSQAPAGARESSRGATRKKLRCRRPPSRPAEPRLTFRGTTLNDARPSSAPRRLRPRARALLVQAEHDRVKRAQSTSLSTVAIVSHISCGGRLTSTADAFLDEPYGAHSSNPFMKPPPRKHAGPCSIA